MEFNAYIALLRATARLHPNGDVDPHLIEALGRLIAPHRRGGPSPIRQNRQPAGTARAHGSEDKPQDSQKNVQADPLASSLRQPGAAKPKAATRQKRDRGDNLVAIESELVLISEQADLVVEQQGKAAQDRRRRSAPVEPPTVSPPVADLFPDVRVRAVMREMATLSIPSGRPDLQAAVKLISSGRPIEKMPQLLMSALPHAILWLFEAGPTMLPFSRDKQQLARTTIRLLGEDRIRIADFIADPMKGIRPRGQVKWQPLRWPSRHSAIVVVSDLGIGGTQVIDVNSQHVWMTLLEEAERRGIHMVLLNPYEPDRWPAVSAAFDTTLTWDTETGVQELRHKRRLGKGRLRS